MKHFKFETNLLNKIYIFLWDKHHLSCFCISVKFVTRLKFYIFSMDINRKVRYIHFWWITLIIPSSVVHLLVHPNHWNIISGTGSCTWPVNFDQPVHPITLQLKTTLEKTLRCRVSLFYLWYRYLNSRENPRTKRSLFAPLKIFFWKKS